MLTCYMQPASSPPADSLIDMGTLSATRHQQMQAPQGVHSPVDSSQQTDTSLAPEQMICVGHQEPMSAAGRSPQRTQAGALCCSRQLTLTQLILHGQCIWRFWQVRSLRQAAACAVEGLWGDAAWHGRGFQLSRRHMHGLRVCMHLQGNCSSSGCFLPRRRAPSQPVAHARDGHVLNLQGMQT